MKKAIVLLIAIVFLLLCTQTYADDISVWLWGGEGTNVRLGYLFDPNEAATFKDSEVGVSVSWWDSDEEPRFLGMYFVRHLPDVIEVSNPLAMSWLPETLVGSPYFGAKLEMDIQVDKTIFTPVAGIIIDPFFIEHRFESFDGVSTTIVGIRFEF